MDQTRAGICPQKERPSEEDEETGSCGPGGSDWPGCSHEQKKRRRADYDRVQNLYRANRSECSRKILSGEWQNEATPGIPLEDQVSFWSQVFGEEWVVDERVVHSQGMVLWSLVGAITADEIYPALRKSKQGAAGLDKIMRDDIRKQDPRALLAHFNLWLYAGYQPAEFRRSRTVLFRRCPNPLGQEGLVQLQSHHTCQECSTGSWLVVFRGSWSSTPDKEPL